MRSPNTHLEFDLDLAKQAREKNPVFYLQYAHARICSIIRKAQDVGFAFDDTIDLTLLSHDAEKELIKKVIETEKELICRPCGLHGKKTCPLGHFECAYTIQKEQFDHPEFSKEV